ncbi:MAG: T9SS type A sorting domain-containing protein [Candidatus Electryonea clarkiae]|nr:T9SS type A sorting domain-containing protein [Candidatus Electryonea clarkiae]MDP8285700.1 T9SS type A sorting domain-containing protein [Candidatus Electryonea clarkiae]
MSRLSYFIVTLVLLLTWTIVLNATPYVDPLILQQQYVERLRIKASRPSAPQFRIPNELDEYDYYAEWEQILDWLPSLQITDQGPNFGGMREGEAELNLAQTDNTQEALRDWCRYGYLTGDTSTYRENIDAAWEYCLEWPAWLEEGGNHVYYRVHNSGWGCVATMEYVRTYGDSTFLEYGDECADYLDTYRLDVNGLNALASGSGAGMLYHYGVWRDNQDWIDAAVEIAEDVRDWIERNQNNVNYETWVMSGGTAVWGVVTALYLDDHEAGIAWIEEYTEDMNTVAFVGNMNNSFTIWYGHAWNAIYQVTGDPQAIENVIECTESLLVQDDDDDDGGVPSTQGQDDDDQSWTSAYLCWFTLEFLIDIDSDIRPLRVTSPIDEDTLYIGFPVELGLDVAHVGSDSLFDVSVNVQIDDFESEELFEMNPFGTSQVTFEDNWIPSTGGEHSAIFIVNHEDDQNHDNDTLYATIFVEEGLLFRGRVYDSATLNAKPARIDVVVSPRSEDREIIYTFDILSDSGYFSELVEGGIYTFEISPLASPYAFQVLDSIEISAENLPFVNIALDSANLLYISQQLDGIYDHHFLYSLLDMERSVYPVRTGEIDYPVDSLEQFQSIIWSTGDLDDNIFMLADRYPIYNYVENGGSMLLTGQGLQDRWGSNFFMSTRFGATIGELGIDSHTMIGNNEIAIVPRDTLFISGPDGADNQFAPDEITPTDDSIPVLFYENSEMAAAIAFEHPEDGYRTVYCAFGVEAIPYNPEVDDIIDRAGFLENVLLWLNFEENILIGEEGKTIPTSYSLAAYPNPFNSTLRISIELPKQSQVKVRILNVLGRHVKSWNPGVFRAGSHSYLWNAEKMSSGIYFVHLEVPGKVSAIRKVVLMK